MSKEQSIQKSTFSTVIVMGCTFLSRILGFVRVVVITAVFGASGKADVINLTFAIPNNLRKLLAEGALSSAFIPVLSESIIVHGTKSVKTRSIVRSLFTFQLLILIPLSLMSIFFAKPLIEHVLTQFKDPEQIDLSISLFRYFINYLIFISISAVMIGVLNSTNHFFIPAITPILFSISVIISIITLHKFIGIYSMVFGVLLGGLLQVVFQYPLFKKLGFDFKPVLNFSDPKFKQIIKHWLPVLATSSIFTINQQIAFLFASGLEKGSTSALANALVFWQLPFGIFSASITTVLFPRMSRQAAVNDTDGIRESISVGLRMLFSLLIPSAFVLGIFGKLIIAVTLQRGLFTADNTYMTANVLAGYVLGLFGVGAFNYLQRYFYASKDFKTPFCVAVFVCALDVFLSVVLKQTALKVSGLAVANSISFTVGFILLYILIRKKLEYLMTIKILITMLKVIVSIIPALLFSFYIHEKVGKCWYNGSSIENIIYLLIIFIFWILSTLFMYRVVKNEILIFLIEKRGKNV